MAKLAFKTSDYIVELVETALESRAKLMTTREGLLAEALEIGLKAIMRGDSGPRPVGRPSKSNPELDELTTKRKFLEETERIARTAEKAARAKDKAAALAIKVALKAEKAERAKWAWRMDEVYDQACSTCSTMITNLTPAAFMIQGIDDRRTIGEYRCDKCRGVEAVETEPLRATADLVADDLLGD